MKKNYIKIIIIVSFLAYLTIYSINYKINVIDNKKGQKTYERVCNIEENIQTNYCQYYFSNNKNVKQKYDTLTVLYDYADLSIFGYLQVFAVIIISAVVFKKINFDKLSKYYLNRLSFNSYKQLLLKKAYSCIWYLPILLFILFVCSYIISGTFDYSYTLYSGRTTYDLLYLKMGIKFFILLDISLIFMSIIYVSYALIAYKISNNKLLASILSFVLLLLTEGFLNILIGDKFLSALHIQSHMYLSLLNTFTFYDISNPYIYILIRIIIGFILFLIVLILYNNKEKYINCIEIQKEI